MQKANPLELVRLPREKSKEFTDPTFTVRERQTSQNHYAIRPERTLGIQHRLTNGMTPKINAAVGPSIIASATDPRTIAPTPHAFYHKHCCAT